jgi:CoA-transferase family III
MSWADVAGDPATAYARQLLAQHGVDIAVAEPDVPRTSNEDWARSGAMALTGAPDGPPQLIAGAPATTARGALLALGALATAAGLDSGVLPDERILGERAAEMRLTRGGRTSAGGACRLLDAADGTAALTLSRPEDVAAVAALIESPTDPNDPWQAVTTWCATRNAEEIVGRAALLGLAAGVVDHQLVEPSEMGRSAGLERPKTLGSARPLVVDLSSLWAGPLCAHLLGLLGARVIAVESAHRPDPTEQVAPEFHRLLRGEAERLALDLHSAEGLASLHGLIAEADIVIEASRPRALAQLGIDAEEFSTTTWLSITAYGRDTNRIGYGDDVAAAAGLLGSGPVFAGDAIADPLTGTHAAVAALAAWSIGATGITEVAMYDVARAARTELPDADVLRRDDQWFVDDGSCLVAVREPALRQASPRPPAHSGAAR